MRDETNMPDANPPLLEATMAGWERIIPRATLALAESGLALVLVETPTADAAGSRAFRHKLAEAIATSWASGMSCSVQHDGRGAPYFTPKAVQDHATTLHCSFSSRAGYSLVGVSRRRIGVDIEAVSHDTSLPENVLRLDEREHLASLNCHARTLAFSRLWAAKEAAAKALGLGFTLPPEAIFVGMDTVSFANSPVRDARDAHLETATLLTWQHNRASSPHHNDVIIMGCSALSLAAVLLPEETG